MNCLRCDTKMNFMRKAEIQLGKTGWILGDLPNLLSGAMEVNIYICPNCGKMEFFRADKKNDFSENVDDKEELIADEFGTPQRKCPNCGSIHDFDFPKCPYCKFDYYEKK